MPKGIIIAGPSGSGKTTLGRALAREMDYPYFDVDDFIWRKDTPEPFTKMFSRAEKIENLQNAIASHAHFVMAGNMSSFHAAFDPLFEMMALLYAAPDIRVERVAKRALERFGDRVREGGDMYESNQRFLADNRRYETDGSPNLAEQQAWFASVPCKHMTLDGADAPMENVKRIIEEYTKPC